MKFVAIILIFIYCGNTTFCQNVTINQHNVSIKKILIDIRNQTGYYFGFTNGNIPKDSRYTLIVKNIPLREALDILFKDKPYTYVLMNHTILITSRKNNSEQPVEVRLTLNGKVENEFGDPIEGATISIGGKGTISDATGVFSLSGFSKDCILEISSIGYEPQKIAFTDKTAIHIKLKLAAQGLDETVVIGYGKTSHKLITGNVFKVKGTEISDQPVTNFVSALSGRVTGMEITQSNGLPGTAYKVQIHGRASIGNSNGDFNENYPLFIVDGVPFAPNNNNLHSIPSGSALGEDGRNAFDLLNTNDIESIEVLKGADATAIYGSRGANGIILITTKKGQIGKPIVTINASTGFGKTTRYPELMNTQEYTSMRREAITNDGRIPNSSNAPDLFKWDTTRYTNFKKLLIGNTARINNLHFSISGGTKQTLYLLSSSLYNETTVYPGDVADNRYSSHLQVNHQSKNRKLKADFSIVYSHDFNKSLSRDLTASISLPPNAPSIYDSSGNLNWEQGGLPFNNPIAALNQPFNAKTNNIITGLNINYNLLKNLSLRVNTGINNISIDESLLQPRKSFNTFVMPNVKASSNFAYSKINSRIIEPQLEYRSRLAGAKVTLLAGGTYQDIKTRITNIAAVGFPNDSLLYDLKAAENVSIAYNNTDYKYAGVFGRISYNYLDKYLVNLTGRRDGSSRFGQGKQFGNFGAVGAGWIFSNELFFKKWTRYITFGKLKASYGLTGNDQIGDYMYLDSWEQTQSTYQGNTGQIPISPANSNFSWEENRKLEGSIDIGIFNNKIMLSALYYRNRTGNQIITMEVPAITGFDIIRATNYPAVVQNSGWELGFEFNTNSSSNFHCQNKFNLTIPKNKLLAFPDIARSAYANRNYIVGKSLSSIKGLIYKGVNSTTGLFEFKDLDNDGNINSNDYTIIANTDPVFYGSWLNSISYKGLGIDLLVEFKKKMSYNILNGIYLNKTPGLSRNNQPTLLTDYWRKQGDQSFIQKLTASSSSAAYTQIDNFLNSNGVISDASYIRIKFLSISYSLSGRAIEKLHLKRCRFYLSSNNLAIVTPFKGTDPESKDIFTLPPLTAFSFGIQVVF